MSSDVADQATARTLSNKDLDLVRDRLAKRHPGTDAAEIDRALSRAHAAFIHAPVRTYLTILVERAAHHRLAAHAA
ncbi:MAG: three-helix bundle dimerization domain-containing protein [Acidimicrobiales bacterium]